MQDARLVSLSPLSAHKQHTRGPAYMTQVAGQRTHTHVHHNDTLK